MIQSMVPILGNQGISGQVIIICYDSVAAIFGTRASNRNEDQLPEKVEGTWVFKDELVNILVEDE